MARPRLKDIIQRDRTQIHWNQRDSYWRMPDSHLVSVDNPDVTSCGVSIPWHDKSMITLHSNKPLCQRCDNIEEYYAVYLQNKKANRRLN